MSVRTVVFLITDRYLILQIKSCRQTGSSCNSNPWISSNMVLYLSNIFSRLTFLSEMTEKEEVYREETPLGDCCHLSAYESYWFGECIDSRTYKRSRGSLAILSIMCVTTSVRYPIWSYLFTINWMWADNDWFLLIFSTRNSLDYAGPPATGLGVILARKLLCH